MIEATTLGAAFLAGLAVGAWADEAETAALFRPQAGGRTGDRWRSPFGGPARFAAAVDGLRRLGAGAVGHQLLSPSGDSGVHFRRAGVRKERRFDGRAGRASGICVSVVDGRGTQEPGWRRATSGCRL